MGSCFSMEEHGDSPPPTAKVVSVNGDLREYNLPMFVSQALLAESSSSSSSPSSRQNNCFICNSDSLFYDDYIPALDLGDQLQANQIYFVLPNSKLQQRLTASDMAALAVKASVALQNASKKDSRRRKKARISPVIPVPEVQSKVKLEEKAAPSAGGFSRSGSVRKIQRYTSRRAKMAVRSFRLRLSTIYEGSVL
ncbi:uncharacterized protein LOC110810331 [Carica papaya]|uniref:uncharacterized protein LOC110810331 n=1 Tax=Carica papaya TaxID=3649 RepID=UPI000B8C8F1F|nr:uncharacterized protein LOC110810331 [Carica papaya]